jgi:hypothetical protein
MSTEIEAALRAAFEEAGEDVTPRRDLADRVRAATRRRRRRIAVACSLAAAVAVSASAYAAVALGPDQHRPPVAPTGRHHGPRVLVRIPAGAGVQALAIAGRYLYAATDYAGNPPYALSAYDRVTGALIGRVRVPAMPASLHTGPGGTVWLSFYADQGGGPSETWLLTADLSRHSSYRLGPVDLLPTGPRTALLATQYRLTELHMPFPGTPGHAVARADPSGAINGRFAVFSLTAIDGRVAAGVIDGAGRYSHVVIAGRPRVTYGGGDSSLVGYITAQDHGIWATTSSGTGPAAGPLVRLGPSLRVITPRAVRTSPILRQSEQVWSHGSTVWVASAAAGHRLVCFSYRGRMSPLATVSVPGQPAVLAAAGDTIYVSFTSGVADATSDIRAYPVPAACR